MVLGSASGVNGECSPTRTSVMSLPGFGNKFSPSRSIEPPGTAATLRAQSHLLAARERADGSFAAGLSNTYVAKRPEVGIWLFGGASDRPPVGKLTDIGFVYRAAFDDQPQSALALHGECLMSQVILGPFVMGTVLDAREGHPFVPLGAAVCDIPFRDVCLRRRFAIDLSAACLDYVEAASMIDGRVLVHERRAVLTETSQFFHEAIRWYNSAGPIAEAPPQSSCLAQLLMRCWERKEVCLRCNPGGVAVRQPCPHKVADVRGLPILSFDEWCGCAKSLDLAGVSSIELQQYAAADVAVSPEAPVREEDGRTETGVVVALPPVGYRYSFHRTDDALSFFSESMRRSILGGGDQPTAHSSRLGAPIYQATVALADKAAALEGGTNEDDDEPSRRSNAYRLVSKLSRAIERLPPGFHAAFPTRESTALPGAVPTEVNLWEGSTGSISPRGLSPSSGANTHPVAVPTDAAIDREGSYSGSGVLIINAAEAATSETYIPPSDSAALYPRACLTDATILGNRPTIIGAPFDSWDQEGSGFTQVAEDGKDLRLPIPLLPRTSAELPSVQVEQARCGLTRTVEPVTARRTNHRDSDVADIRATAEWTGPRIGRVTRAHSSRFLKRGPLDMLFSILPVQPQNDAGPSTEAAGPSTGRSSSLSSSSLEPSLNVQGLSKADTALRAGDPIALPRMLRTGGKTSSEDPLADAEVPPGSSFAATTPLVIAAEATASRQPGRERHADAPPRRAKVHPCTLCDASFASRSDAVRHITTVHERRRQWPCEYPGCKFTGLQKGHLTTHVAAVHHSERPYVCPECRVPGRPPFRSISRSAVERHVRRVHRGIRPYGCPSCRHAFASRSDLRRHCMRQHGAAPIKRDSAGGPATHTGQAPGAAESAGVSDAAGAAATPSRAIGPLSGSGTVLAAVHDVPYSGEATRTKE